MQPPEKKEFLRKTWSDLNMMKDSYGHELHSAICSDCGKETQVPFKPRENRPVYCRECQKKKKKKKKKHRNDKFFI
jgi:CxxC-x17-CxxC domain-containing protein